MWPRTHQNWVWNAFLPMLRCSPRLVPAPWGSLSPLGAARTVVEQVLLWVRQNLGAAPHLCPTGTACWWFGVQSVPIVFSHEPGNGTFLSPLPAHWPFVSGFELKRAQKVQIITEILKDSPEIRHRIPVAVEWGSGSGSFKLF